MNLRVLEHVEKFLTSSAPPELSSALIHAAPPNMPNSYAITANNNVFPGDTTY